MLIKIDPLDTLFFRDAKSFTMGEDSWANTIFPPPPSVIYGALRSCFFANNIDELGKANEENDPTKNLQIKGIYFQDKEGNVFLPLPRDCSQKKDDPRKAVLLKKTVLKGVISSCPTTHVLKAEGEVESLEDCLITQTSLKEYLEGNKKIFSVKKSDLESKVKSISYDIIELSEKVISEPKVGIGLNRNTGAADTDAGKLYHIDLKRMKDLSLLVEFEELNIPETGLMKLGGEGKAIRYQEIDTKITAIIPTVKLEGKIVKIYLSTPTIFKKGWLPSSFDEKTLEGELKPFNSKGGSVKVKLLTAAIGKCSSLGGFNIKERKPKPMYKVVPAGSVYYFEILDSKNAQQVFDLVNKKAISEIYGKQGFGIAYVGGMGKSA